MEDRDNIYLVVTATGDAGGLSELTRALHGREVPKALAMIASEGSLLQQTVKSFSSALEFQKVVVLVPKCDEASARNQLEGWCGVEVVAVPQGHGGACALLLVLSEILLESPQAEIVVISAECYLPHPRPFIEAVLRARVQLGLVPAVLLGAAATGPKPGQRWLVPGVRLGEEVFGLVDAPIPRSEEECVALHKEGAMWNTSAFVARGPSLLRVLARAMPLRAEAIAQAWRTGRSSLSEGSQALAALPASACAREPDELMIHDISNIAVARVEGAGWNDWRTPEQVFHSLPNRFELGWLLSRLSKTLSAH